MLAYNHELACLVLISALRGYYNRAIAYQHQHSNSNSSSSSSSSSSLVKADMQAIMYIELALIALKAADTQEKMEKKVHLLLYNADYGIYNIFMRCIRNGSGGSGGGGGSKATYRSVQ